MRTVVVYAICWIIGLAAALQRMELEAVFCAGAIILAVVGGLLLQGKWKQLLACLVVLILAFGYGSWAGQRNTSELPSSGSLAVEGAISSVIEVEGDRARFHLRVAEAGNETIAVTIRIDSREEQEWIQQFERGDRARLRGEIALPLGARNFGQFDYADYLEKKRIHRVFTVEGLGGAEFAKADRFTMQHMLGVLERYRQLLGERVAELYPGMQSGFMQGLLIGLRSEMDETLFQQFSELGLTHVIAISGLHVAIVVGGLLGLFRLLRFTRETALNAVLWLIPLYILLSGASPSVVRAGIMGMLGIYAVKRGIMKDALQLLALTGIAMTLWNPFLLYDIGFQLSFLVTAGLIVGVPAARRLLPERGPNWLYNTVSVTVTAQCVSFPLTIYYFNQYALLSGLANFLLVPLFSMLVLPIGYISLAGSFIFRPLGDVTAAVAGWMNAKCFTLMSFLTEIPGLLTIWPSPPISAVMLYLFTLYALSLGVRWWRMDGAEQFPMLRRRGMAIAVSGMLVLAVWVSAVYGMGKLGIAGTISFIDVGQGDAILIRTPKDRVILVDGGGTLRFHKPEETWRLGNDPYEVGKDLVVPLLKKRGVQRIDYVIVSHGDTDHIGGLTAVLEHIPVERLLFNGTVKDSPAVERLFRTALEQDIPLFPVHAGQTLEVDENTRLTFLYPFQMDKVVMEEDQNASSVVFLMEMHKSMFLLTGDMDAAAERDVVENLAASAIAAEGGRIGPVDVLKVAHHGSKTSTSDLWLQYWQPKTAVISVGVRNMYRHPSPVVMERLNKRGIPTARTDLHGEVQIRVDEEGIKLRKFLP